MAAIVATVGGAGVLGYAERDLLAAVARAGRDVANADRPWPGIRVAGEAAPAGRAFGAWLDERARAVEARTITVAVEGVPGAELTATAADLGVHVDRDRVAAIAAAIGREGTIFDRVPRFLASRRGAFDVPWSIDVDAARVRDQLAALKEQVEVQPTPARLDLAHHTTVPHADGASLDLDAAVDAVQGAALAGVGRLVLVRVAVAPRTSDESLARLDVHEVLASFETRFSRAGDQANRARNIERAAARLDGVVLMPGELFSFNAAVGPRTVDNGFAQGWEIFKGELVPGIGGGTCQAASTFHAAAYLAGLGVEERMPHSRPSAYIPMGLDATVVYPSVDLKIRNPWAFPVVVHTEVEASLLRVELLGREKPARVTFNRDVVGVRPFTRKVDEQPGLKAGRVVRKQHGIRGYTVRRTRTIALADGTERTEESLDVYPPTTEIYLVPPGTDAASALPPLPADVAAARAAAAAGAAVASVTPQDEARACSEGGCEGDKPVIVEGPGVHRPVAEQASAPTRLVISR